MVYAPRPDEPIMGRKPKNGDTVKVTQVSEVFTIDEGEVTISYPSPLSPESCTDLDAQLALFSTRVKRAAEKAKAEAAAAAAEAKGDGDDE